MPTPRQGESQSAFMDRCMGDNEAVSDFPDRDQRLAVCTSIFERKGNSLNVGEQIRVNVKSKVNQSGIMRGERNGREVIIVPSATLPDDVVMNGVKYPSEEIEASFRSLDRTPAPLGHPMTEDGEFLSSTDVEALNGFYFGAFNDNARRRDGRVFVDKVIDVQRAEESDMGKRVLEALNQGDPIHTSTGLLCNIEEAGEDDGFDFIARNIIFDHDAILLDEPGAATPSQGVGMLVNKARDQAGNEITVFNVELEDIEEALTEPQKVGLLHFIKTAVKDAFASGREIETNSNEVDMTDVTKDQFDELSAKVETLANALNELDLKAVVEEAVEPLSAQVNSLTEAQNAEKEAKHAALVESVVNKNILDEETAKATPDASLEVLLKNATGTAAPILGGFQANAGGLKYEEPEE